VQASDLGINLVTRLIVYMIGHSGEIKTKPLFKE